MRALCLALAAVLAAPGALAQQVLFPGQSGDALRESLRQRFKPSSGQLRSSGDTKDLMMFPIWTVDEGSGIGVQDVYTGWFVPFDNDPPGNANQEVFNGGAASGLNQEHVWPRSRIADGGARPSGCDAAAECDLHHLFPARVDVNSDRGSLPFAEIDDAQTTRWYTDGVETSTAPTDDRDAYSELRSGVAFEPRESVEGDVARAMFYVATMYPEAADLAWFSSQERDLFDWHRADPADDAETERTQAIAGYQGGTDRENPFVLDSTLVRRAFFPDITVTDAERAPAALSLRLGPTPARGDVTVTLDVPTADRARIEVFDVRGRRVALLHDGRAPAGPLALRVGAGLRPGVYLVRAVTGGTVATRTFVRL